MDFNILKTQKEAGYELIDSGDGEKLERYGEYLIARPDPQAIWKKTLSDDEWQKAHAYFSPLREGSAGQAGSGWKMKPDVPERWPIELAGLKFWIRPTSFKHTGLFPEQASNWNWIKETIKGKEKIKVLNLFGYTGGATLAASAAGAEVVHLDGSKVAITWAKDNAELSGLKDNPIRWILDDARTFIRREIKRGNRYHGIIMDPPSFGHGPEGEVWKIEDHLVELLEACAEVLDPNPLFIILNGYASGYSALTYKNLLENLMKKWKGSIEIGELTIEETAGNKLLPAGIFARWRAE